MVQPSTNPPCVVSSRYSIPDTQVFDVTDKATGNPYRIIVGAPSKPVPPDTRVPAVYIVDANLMFGTVIETTRLMEELGGELPSMYVIGIGYQTDSRMEASALRNRDLTPVPRQDWDDRMRGMPMVGNSEKGFTGGADKFLAFIERDVKPLVRAKFPIDDKVEILAGTSLGGLFSLYALLTQPDQYDTFIVGSPSIWWDENFLYGLEAKLSQSRQDLPAHVFIGVGEFEDMGPFAHFKMLENVKRMSELLNSRRYPSLNLKTEIFANDGHNGVVPLVFSRGLRYRFPRQLPPPGARMPPSSPPQ